MALGPRLNPLFVPTVPVTIDRYQSLSQGLTAYWLLNTPGAPVDLTGRYGTAAPGPISAPVPVVTPAGRGQFWATQTVNRTGWTVFGGKILSGLANWSAVATISTTVPDNQQAIYCERSFSNGQDILKFGQSVSALGNGMGAVLRDDGGTLISTGDGVSIATGVANTVAITFDNANLRQYSAGKLRLTSPWTGTQTFTSANIISTIGFDANDNSASWAGSILQVALFTTTLSSSQVAQLSTEPFIMLRPVVRRTFYGAATGGTSFTATPGVGLIGFSGLSPAPTATAALAPGAGQITVTGNAPTLAAGVGVTPGAGLIGLSGLAPTIAAGVSVAPGAGTITLTGLLASVSTGANVTALPGSGLIGLSGLAPTVSAGVGLVAGAGMIALSGLPPAVSAGVRVSPGSGLIGIAGAHPGVSASASLTAGMGTITLTGLAPTVSTGVNVNALPGAGAVMLTGYAPTVSTGGGFPPFTPAPQRTSAIAGQSRFGSIPRRSRFGVIH